MMWIHGYNLLNGNFSKVAFLWVFLNHRGWCRGREGERLWQWTVSISNFCNRKTDQSLPIVIPPLPGAKLSRLCLPTAQVREHCNSSFTLQLGGGFQSFLYYLLRAHANWQLHQERLALRMQLSSLRLFGQKDCCRLPHRVVLYAVFVEVQTATDLHDLIYSKFLFTHAQCGVWTGQLWLPSSVASLFVYLVIYRDTVSQSTLSTLPSQHTQVSFLSLSVLRLQ